MQKRIISLVLAVIMCLSVPLPGVLASTTPTPVTDVGQSNYAVAKQTELESILLLRNKDRKDGSKNMLPLKDSDKIAIFGNGQRAPISGSSGSGTVTGAFTYTLIEGLDKIGGTYDKTLAAYYASRGSNHGWDTSDKSKWGQAQSSGTGWSMSSPIAAPELKIDDGEVKEEGLVAGAIDDGATAAIVYLQRQVGTEEMDRASNPPQPSDWYLNPSEKTLLKQVTDKFDDIIVIINTAGSIDMSWLSFDWLAEDPDYNDGGAIGSAEAAARAEKIRSIVWMYGAGSYHGLALAELMYGMENFSAKLADTITYTYEDHYTSDKFGGNQTYASNGTKPGFGNNGINYNTRWGENDPAIIYSEYIYTGYRYFDTFAGDKAGTADDPVLFEFGFGKSYSDFEFSDFNVAFDAATESFNVSAKITNVSADGSLPSGKEVVEVYLSAPNDQSLDQPYQILVGYDKTQKLAKGESETITVNVPAYYMASYDEAAASYIMEQGDYYFRVGNSSRNTRIAGVVTAEEKITVEQLVNKLTLNDAGSDENQAEFDSVRLNSQTDSGKTLVNPNDAADIAACGNITLAQSDIEIKTASYDTEYTVGTAPEDKAYTLQAVMNRDISIEDFAAQLTKDELSALLSGGVGIVSTVGGNPYRYYSDDSGVNLTDTASKPSGTNVRSSGAGSSRNIQRLGIPSVTYADGSAGISISSSLANNVNYDQNAGYNRAAGAACTWNPELQYEWGQALGNDMLAINVDILLAPSLNLHRNPLNGRNTEYYSEDPMLTGFIAANVASGVASRGVTVCLKHFAGNDQEQYRRGFYTNASVAAGTSKDAANTISSERALRETTLRAFEIPVETSEVHSVMSAFNKINSQECAASEELLTDILRGEWGFDGYVVTDWGDFDDIAHAANEMRSGNDMIMSGRHERYSIPDQLYYSIVDEYDMSSANPYGGRDDGLVSMADLQRNAKNVLTTIMNSSIAFDSDGNYNLSYINGSSVPYHVERDLSVLTTKLPVALVGVDYSNYKTNPLLATGSEGTTYYKFSVAESSKDQMPEGLTLSGNGTITGTPAPGSAGWYNITFQVEDSFGNTATKELSLEVSNVAITNDSIENPRIGLEYSQQLNAAGGAQPYTFSVDMEKGNALPKGLTLDENTGLISGTPDDPSEIGKTFNIVLTVTDSEGSTGLLTKEIELLDYVTMQLGSFTSPTVLARGENIGYTGISLSRADGDSFLVSATGLPTGLAVWGFGSMNLFMGTVAAEPGEYNAIFTVKVNGTDISVDIPFTFVIYDAGDDLTFISDTLPVAKKNENYSTMAPVVGGKGTKTFTLAEESEKPAGLKLNESTGEITWTPGASQYGLHKLVIQVSDDVTSITKTFWLQVDAGISMSPANGTEFELKEGEAFERQITAAGYSTSVTYHVSSKGDQLPDGVTLSTEGILSGTPKTAGTFNVIIEAKEVGGALTGAMAAYKLVVEEDITPVVTATKTPTSVTLTWPKIDGAAYTVAQKVGGLYTNLDVEQVVSGNNVSVTISGLEPDTSYEFRVTAALGDLTEATNTTVTTDREVTYTVTYRPNGGTGSSYSVTVNSGSTHTVLSNTDSNLGFSRSGYTFTGWNTKADGTGTSYEAGSGITVTGQVDLYAQWKITEVKLPFTDVKESDWYYDAISYVYRTNLFKGTGATIFEPQTAMTREMFVTVLARMAGNLGEDISGYTSDFKDVPKGQWYSDAIAWGAAKGIVKGYRNDTFGLGDKITREQMAALFVRYAEYAGITLDDTAGATFTDASSISPWAAADVDTAAKAGLFIGEDGKFYPQRTATRAETAQVFTRFATLYIDK